MGSRSRDPDPLETEDLVEVGRELWRLDPAPGTSRDESARQALMQVADLLDPPCFPVTYTRRVSNSMKKSL